MANPFMFLAPLNGSLAYQDRAGGGTLTGSGAIRYAAASGARWNLWKNPSFETSAATEWTWSNGTSSRSSEQAMFGSYSGKIIANAANASLQATIIPTAGSWVASIYVYNGNASNRTIVCRGSGSDDAGTVITPGVWTRVQITRTWGEGNAAAFIFKWTDSVNNDVFYFDGAQVESGTVATAYIDGSVGGVWVSPLTGILGTAHASQSVTQATAWIEEGTTNTIPDPSFEAATITTNWSAINVATISKITTYKVSGSNGGKVSCTATTSDGIGQLSSSGGAASTGQVWTLSGQIKAFAGGDVGKSIVPCIAERDVSNALVLNNAGTPIVLTDAWKYFSYTVTLSGGGTVTKVTCRFLNGAASAVDFVLDCVQLEQKAYATSYCDGSIGTGYAWAGTAHASASTRTTANLSWAVTTSQLSATRGEIVARYLSDYNNSATGYIFQHVGPSTSRFYFYISATYKLTAGLGASAVMSADPASVVADTSYFGSMNWDGSNGNLYKNAALVDGPDAYTGLSGSGSASGYIGQSGGATNINGYVNNFAIFDRPLTTKERTRLYNTASWGWNILRSGFRHRKIV